MNNRRVVCLAFSLSLISLAYGCGLSKGRPVSPGVAPGTGGPNFTLKINAKSNVFRAGAGDADANGGGEPAPSTTFHAGAGKVLTFSDVSGNVSCCGGGEEFNDADGGTFAGGVTDVESAGGISGITHPNKTMFLVAVFTDNSTPQLPGPPRLDATSGENLTPQLFQTFFVGTGKGREVQVPPTASRLYLGFADASSFTGVPGSYDDNVGELKVVFSISPKPR
jgi:hypothetical protein